MGVRLKLVYRTLILVSILSFCSGLNIEIRSDSDDGSVKVERNIKLSTSKKTISHHLTPFKGIIVDKPRLRVLSYRIKNADSWTITDEMNCAGGKGSGEGGLGNCDELVELGLGAGPSPDIPKRLGQGEGETEEWSLPPNVTQLTIECTSKTGPVQWDYVGKGNFPDIEIDNVRVTGDFWTATTYTHISSLTFKKVSDQLTGSFVCRNVEKPSISNSFYLFVPQEKLEVYKGSLEVIPPSHESTVVIPCRPEDKATSVHLYKRMKDGSLKKMNLRPGVSFTPYIGFLLPSSPDVYGHYICKIDKVDKKSEPSIRKKRSVETSTSPGISAFPTSDEDRPPASEYYTNAVPFTAGSSEDYLGQNNPEITGIDRPEAPPLNYPSRRRFRLRRRRPNLNGFRRRVSVQSPSVLSHRGGPPPPTPGESHRPHYNNRRPPPPPHFRRPGGPGLFPHLRFRPRPRPPYHHNHYGPQYHDQQLLSVVPLPVMSEPQSQVSSEEISPTNATDSPQTQKIKIQELTPTSEDSTNKILVSHPYFYPAPPFHHQTPLTMTPIKVLPTYTNNKVFRPNYGGSGGFSSEENSSGENKNYKNNTTGKKPPRRGAAAILSENLLPQTMNIVSSMSCVLKKVMLGPDAPCDGSIFDAAALRRRNKPGYQNSHHILGLPEDQQTILEVDVKPPPTNKFFPQESILYTTVPFFVKWQTRSTDFANWAEVNHTLKEGTYKLHKAGHFEDHGVHSFEVFGLVEGDSGRISVPYVTTNNKIMEHTWKFHVINSTMYNAKGLVYKEGHPNTFTCRATSVNKPTITLTPLNQDGCSMSNDSETDAKKSVKFEDEDCGEGCAMIKTEVENGIVHCLGDGVDQTIRFPSDVYCTGRPFFIERLKTKNLTLPENQKRLSIPCIINNPNADVYLYHETMNGTVEEVTNHATYDLKAGFSLDLDKIPERLGTYACTSTTNLQDDSDMVTYHVNPAPAYVFDPPGEKVFGSPPFRFVWESTEELEVENKTIGSFYSGVFAKPEGNRPFVGTFEITTLKPGQSGEVRVLKTSDKSVVHTWKYSYEGKYGLYVDKKTNVVKCKTSSSVAPSLFPVECENPNVCKFKKQFTTVEVDPQEDEDDRDIVKCGKGCTELKIWKNKPYGFVKCTGEGVDDTLNYFLSKNSTLLTEMDNLDRFRTIEISSVIRKLRVGETVNFVCKANKYFYSKGFQWAIETRTGSKRFIDPKTKDVDSYLNEVKSEISLKVGEDWKAVWCYGPKQENNLWGNASQLIYLH